MEKLVSVIVPVYNAGMFLRKSVSCILRQTYTNIEVLLVDDGSIDDSFDIMKELAETDSRIRVFHQENRGSGSARNVGIENARGEYYYFPDSDDEINENTVLKLVEAMESQSADMVVCGYSWVGKERKPISTKTYVPKKFDAEYIRQHYDEFMYRDNPYGIYGVMSNKLFRADIIKQNSLRVPTVRRSQDEMFDMMYLSCISSVYFISDVLYYYYICPISLKAKKYGKDFFDKIIAFKNCQMDIAYNWNKENRRVLELIFRNLAVNLDIYIQMHFMSTPWYAFRERYTAIKDACDVLNREIPTRDLAPDFRKYECMLNRSYLKLYVLEAAKVVQNKITERNWR